jgi:CRISPR-associated exonuclease Cas4
MALFLVALLFVAMAIVLLRQSHRERAVSGLPQGRVVFVDSRAWRKPSEPLRAPSYGLVGRPDFLLRQGRVTIPVESKPMRYVGEPYPADLLQLAAYCLLVEETYGRTPPYGLLVYSEHTFEIPFDDGLRQALLNTLDEMRRDEKRGNVRRSHDQPVRCARCGMRRHCGREALLR